MKSRSLMLLAAITLFAALAAQGSTNKIITFDITGGGPGAYQGTISNGIDSSGAVTGWYIDGNNANHGFLRTSDGSVLTFDAPDAGTGSGQGTLSKVINRAGEITGSSVDLNGVYHGFVIDQNCKTPPCPLIPDPHFTMFDVVGAGTGYSQGTISSSINPKGEVTGYYVDANNVSHGFLRDYRNNVAIFDAPGAGTGSGQGTISRAINSAGTVTGSYIDANNVNHGFVEQSCVTEPCPLYVRLVTFDAVGAGTGSGQGTISKDINAKGEVTGYYVDANNVSHGFLRDYRDNVAIFDAPGAGTGPGQGTISSSINAKGEVTGYYVDANNVNHGFVEQSCVTEPCPLYVRIVTFDVAGAGTYSGQGTVSSSINTKGEVTGYYVDANNTSHGFLRTK
jgi:hypothetical protein